MIVGGRIIIAHGMFVFLKLKEDMNRGWQLITVSFAGTWSANPLRIVGTFSMLGLTLQLTHK
jgi:hypothetical protein